MKIYINYDFFNAILDVNEDFTPMKIVRNRKKELAILNPILFGIDYISKRNIPETLKFLLIQNGSFFLGTYVAYFKLSKDIYKEIAINRLKRLAIEFNKNNIKTEYDLLLQSEFQTRNYKIQLNESKIPELMEYKYVLVPTYDFNNNIKNISIEQEHIVGTDNYVLSIGSPKKHLKLVYNNV